MNVLEKRTRQYNLVRILSIATGLIGLIVMLGWIFGIDALESLVPNTVTMKFTTAVSFIMSGIMLYLINESRSKNSELAKILLPAPIMVVLFYMVTLLVSTFTGISSGIEYPLLMGKAGVGSLLSGVPSVGTMISFLLIVSASILSLLRYEKQGREILVIGAIICSISVTALLGYAVNVSSMYYMIPGISSGMAIHTAITFLILGIALVAYSKTSNLESPKAGKFVSIRTKILTIFFSGMTPAMLLILLFRSSSSQNFPTVIPEVVTLLSFTMIASIFISKFISTPIVKLQNIAHEIGEGNFDLDVSISANDEIGQLSSQLEKMKENIKSNDMELRETNQALKKIDKQKEEFSSIISHELKSFLVPIKGYVDLILSEKLGALNDGQKERLRIVSSSTDQLRKLISDILDVQKLEMGVLKLQLAECVLSDLINDVLVKFRTELETYQITVTANLMQNVRCTCDKSRIDQVLVNLINNSIDFCPKMDGKISIDLSLEDEYVKITVADNGSGIPSDKLEKIFVKFYQVDSSTTREHGGTGIGLSICKGIIDAHGGKIWAESKVGQGATFHILLPRNLSKTLESKGHEEIVGDISQREKF